MVEYEWVSVYRSYSQPLRFGTSPCCVFLTQKEYNNMKDTDKIFRFTKDQFIPKKDWSKSHFEILERLLNNL